MAPGALSEGRRALLQAEISALRFELNAVIGRGNQTENFFLLAFGAIVGLTLGDGSAIPQPGEWLFGAVLLALALLGQARHRETKAHIAALCAYIRGAERQLDTRGGWETSYSAANRSTGALGYSGSRGAFWAGALTLALLHAGWMILYPLLQP